MYLNWKQLSLLYNFLQQCLAIQAHTWRRQMMGVLDFQGCCNKLAQMWFQTTEMYSLVVLEAASQKSRCSQAHPPSKNSRGEGFLVSSSFKRLQDSLFYQSTTSISALVFTWCFLCISSLDFFICVFFSSSVCRDTYH